MPHRHHPFFGLFQSDLMPQPQHAPDHRSDPRPPADRLLQEIIAESGSHPGLRTIMMLLAADHECRAHNFRAAEVLLGLAAARLALDLPAGCVDLDRAADALATGRQEAAKGNAALCSAAISTAIFAVLQDRTTH